MGLLKLLGLENEQKPDQALVDENAKLKADNLTLMSRLSVVDIALVECRRDLESADAKVPELELKIKELATALVCGKKRKKSKKSK